jgi:hypothetical protein
VLLVGEKMGDFVYWCCFSGRFAFRRAACWHVVVVCRLEFRRFFVIKVCLRQVFGSFATIIIIPAEIIL